MLIKLQRTTCDGHLMLDRRGFHSLAVERVRHP